MLAPDNPATVEAAEFRREARDWLRANKPRSSRPGDEDFAGQIAFDREWQHRQFEGGWAGLTWPTEFGGRGLSQLHQLIWLEEYAAAGRPPTLDSRWLGLNHAGPTLMAHGTQAQKDFHLPRILKGEVCWSQGFSEPNAGSDLASLRTRAVIDGDDVVINGQKTWTTFGHLSDYQELLVRTGTPESRHRGLTWIICDMNAPGIDVRPMKSMSGTMHNCEIFYDDVRLSREDIVGEVDRGWYVAMTTFEYERGSANFGRLCELVAALEEIIRFAGEESSPGPLAGPEANSLGLLRARLQALRSVAYTMAEADQLGVSLGHEGLIVNLSFAELSQDVYRSTMQLLGRRGLDRSVAHRWIHQYFESFSYTIAGGTSEIQRNMISERLLGLPR